MTGLRKLYHHPTKASFINFVLSICMWALPVIYFMYFLQKTMKSHMTHISKLNAYVTQFSIYPVLSLSLSRSAHTPFFHSVCTHKVPKEWLLASRQSLSLQSEIFSGCSSAPSSGHRLLYLNETSTSGDYHFNPFRDSGDLPALFAWLRATRPEHPKRWPNTTFLDGGNETRWSTDIPESQSLCLVLYSQLTFPWSICGQIVH